MGTKKTTFAALWDKLEPKAKAAGVLDGDLGEVRSSVKNVLISGGWTDAHGVVTFLSDRDQVTALTAAVETIKNVAPVLADQRQAVRASVGFTPTKAQVLSGSATSPVTAAPTPVALSSIQNPAAAPTSAFAPVMAKIGDKCPRCSGAMEPVALANDRAGIICMRDRVVLPLPPDFSVQG